jgi:hypothetical protein
MRGANGKTDNDGTLRRGLHGPAKLSTLKMV